MGRSRVEGARSRGRGTEIVNDELVIEVSLIHMKVSFGAFPRSTGHRSPYLRIQVNVNVSRKGYHQVSRFTTLQIQNRYCLFQ